MPQDYYFEDFKDFTLFLFIYMAYADGSMDRTEIDVIKSKISKLFPDTDVNEKFQQSRKSYETFAPEEIDTIIRLNFEKHREKSFTFKYKIFSDLYQRPSHTPNGTIEDFLSDIPPDIINKHPEEVILNLEKPIHDEEVDFIVNKEHKGSCPGPTGSTFGLLKSIYPIMRPVVRRFAKESVDKESLSPISRLRKIIGIPKPNKPTDQISSIHPICLLEIPYKIISGILAERLKFASTHIIDEQRPRHQE